MSGGPRLPQRPPRPQLPVGKSVVIAVVLSLLIPGIGHLYIGRYLRGLVWFVGAVIIGVIFTSRPWSRRLPLRSSFWCRCSPPLMRGC